MLSAHLDTCALRMAQVRSEKDHILSRRARICHRDVRCQFSWRSANQKEHRRRCCHVRSALLKELVEKRRASLPFPLLRVNSTRWSSVRLSSWVSGRHSGTGAVVSEVLQRQMHQRRWASYRGRVWAKSDTLTLRCCTCTKYLSEVNLRFADGRADAAAKLQSS